MYYTSPLFRNLDLVLRFRFRFRLRILFHYMAQAVSLWLTQGTLYMCVLYSNGYKTLLSALNHAILRCCKASYNSGALF